MHKYAPFIYNFMGQCIYYLSHKSNASYPRLIIDIDKLITMLNPRCSYTIDRDKIRKIISFVLPEAVPECSLFTSCWLIYNDSDAITVLSKIIEPDHALYNIYLHWLE